MKVRVNIHGVFTVSSATLLEKQENDSKDVPMEEQAEANGVAAKEQTSEPMDVDQDVS